MDGRTEREEFAQLTTSLTSMLTNLCRVVLAPIAQAVQTIQGMVDKRPRGLKIRLWTRSAPGTRSQKPPPRWERRVPDPSPSRVGSPRSILGGAVHRPPSARSVREVA